MPTTWLEWKCKASLLDNQWRRFQDMQPKAATNWTFSSCPPQPSSRLPPPHPPPLDPPPPLHPQSPNLWTWIAPIWCRQDNSLLWDPPTESSFMGQIISSGLHHFRLFFLHTKLCKDISGTGNLDFQK